MKLRKLMALALATTMVLSTAACGGGQTTTTAAPTDAQTQAAESATDAVQAESTPAAGSEDAGYVAMITDTGGINDQSFNQSAWEGLQKLSTDTGCKVNYIESKQVADFGTNFSQLADDGATLLWGIGYACADSVIEAAGSNPDLNYAIIDNSFADTPANVTGVMFKAQEPSFIVGYIAALTTQTDKVGFVGGQSNELIDQFQYGYQAGVAYGAKELGKEISVSVQYAESFSDAAKGKAIASKMYSDGCDVIYHAAGGSGQGVIEAAIDADKWVIGVDRDQAYLAPDNMLTSALKLVGTAIEEVSTEYLDGQNIGGQTLVYGLNEGCVGIPDDHTNMGQETYDKAIAVEDKIKSGDIVPPNTEEEFNAFVSGL